MMAPPIPEHIRRFVLTSIPSVPHLEALLLLREVAPGGMDVPTLASRLYIGEKLAHSLLSDLKHGSMVERREAAANGAAARVDYHYHPATAALQDTIDSLAELYSRRLVDVTHLIHSRLERKAQQFADAFKWRKDS